MQNAVSPSGASRNIHSTAFFHVCWFSHYLVFFLFDFSTSGFTFLEFVQENAVITSVALIKTLTYMSTQPTGYIFSSNFISILTQSWWTDVVLWLSEEGDSLCYNTNSDDLNFPYWAPVTSRIPLYCERHKELKSGQNVTNMLLCL